MSESDEITRQREVIRRLNGKCDYLGITLGEVIAERDRLRVEVEALREDAERYLLMRKSIDYTDNGDGTGFYWHNQRGEFDFRFLIGAAGTFPPSFESVIDAARAKGKE